MEYLKIAAVPLFLTAAGVAIVRLRRLDWSEDVGFRAPSSAALVLLWVGLFVALAAAQEIFASGPGARGSWAGRYDATQIAVRIAAIGLIYPIVEEYFFRGVFLGVIRRRFGSAAAVLIPAIIFGIIHTQYDWPVWIVADGILFGAARVATGSVYVPMLLHILGNGYALWERLQ
jgi:membrane protease YdiL (CAAX protease family)